MQTKLRVQKSNQNHMLEEMQLKLWVQRDTTKLLGIPKNDPSL